MDLGFHVNWQQRSMINTFDFDEPHCSFGYPSKKPAAARIVQVHSQGQLKGYLDACKENDKLLVIEFTAAWCGPCRTIEPTIKELATDYANVQFIKIDVDELISVAVQFHAQTLPAFILMKNGKEADRVTGVKMEELRLKIVKKGI